jgi:hypothetical protein
MAAMDRTWTAEVAAAAARLVVDEGMEYGPAKRKAARVLGRRSTRGIDLPTNDEVEDEVREVLELFHADTQPAELAALRRHALPWMQRLAEFRPHLAGAVWRGTATRLSALHLDLYCDDSKGAEIALVNLGLDYDAGSGPADGRGEPTPVLTLASRCDELGDTVTVHLHVRDLDDLRGALRADARGRTLRGDLTALRRLLAQDLAPGPVA